MKKVSVFVVVAFVALAGLTASKCTKDLKTVETVEDKEEHLCGAYTEQRAVTNEEMELFTSVIGTIDTATEYTPLSVATQVVAGLNYKFRCRYDDKTGSAPGFCTVTIYQPLQGDPVLSGIEKE